MTRPSANIDQRLIAAARRLIPRVGFRGLRVRTVCREAGVNPGMFSYHFKTKKVFVECVLRGMYEEFFASFSLEVNRHHDGIEQLRDALLYIGMFVRDNRAMLYPLLQELMLGNEQIIAFARKNMTRHVAIVMEIISRCQQEGTFKSMPAPLAFMTLILNIAAPNILADIATRRAGDLAEALKLNMRAGARRTAGGVERIVDRYILSDAAVRSRVEMVLGMLMQSTEARP